MITSTHDSQQSPPVYVLNSIEVQKLLHDWPEIDRNIPKEDREECIEAMRQDAADVLVFSYEALNNAVVYLLGGEHLGEKDLWESPPHAAIFAIDVLMDFLEATLNHFPYSLGIRDARRCHLVSSVPAILKSIDRTHRCRSLGWRLQLSSTEWYRLLFLPPSGAEQDHTRCWKDNPYGRCLQWDEATTKHRQPDCTCQLLMSDAKVVEDCILNNQIPLIHCYEDDRGKLDVKTVKGDLTSDYTAISHVWAGGPWQCRQQLPVSLPSETHNGCHS